MTEQTTHQLIENDIPHMAPPPLSTPLVEACQQSSEGPISAHTEFFPGLALWADPALGVSGEWRSPPGRLLELDVQCSGPGAWIGLHAPLGPCDLTHFNWLGFACRSAAPAEIMIQPCLRSGLPQGGFVDHFFSKHILATPEAHNQVDTLHLPSTPDIPETAPWRELVLFLPRRDFRWHLHDLRPFLI